MPLSTSVILAIAGLIVFLIIITGSGYYYIKSAPPTPPPSNASNTSAATSTNAGNSGSLSDSTGSNSTTNPGSNSGDTATGGGAVVSGGTPILATTPATNTFNVNTSSNAIYGLVSTPAANGTGITYASTTTDAPTCQTACAGDPACIAYTWTDTTGGSWTNTCYKLDQTAKPNVTVQSGHTTGVIQYNPTIQSVSQLTYSTSPNQSGLINTGIQAGYSNNQFHYYGSAPDETTCQGLCTNDPFCKAYEWADSTQGAWANMCYGIGGSPVSSGTTAQTGRYIGEKRNTILQTATPSERFSPRKWAQSYILKK